MRDFFDRYARYIALAGALCLLVALGGLMVVADRALWIEIVGGVGLLLFAVAALTQPSALRAAVTGRQARYGGNAVLMSLAVLVILGVLNYMGARHHKRWDVTEEKQFSISEQTIQILEELKEPVSVKLFFTPTHYNRQQAEDLIKEYDLRTKNLDYEMVDPDLQRNLTIAYNVARDGTIVFERGDRREVTFGAEEQDLTSALLKVTRDETKTVYFMTGHGERSVEGGDASGYGLVKTMLEAENYAVGSYNPAAMPTAPADMAVLVIADPQKALSSEELDAVRAHVYAGGGVLVLLDPGTEAPMGELLEEFGIQLDDDLVIDPARSFFGDVASPLVDRYGFHQITKDLGGMTTFFPTARSLAPVEPTPAGWTVQMLAETSPNSWAETGYREEQVGPDDDELKGPIGIVAAIEPETAGGGLGRLVVVGDANFVEDGVLQAVRGNVGSVDLFMNAINWLAEEESLISIRPKTQEQRQVVLTSPQARAIIYSNILFVPLIVLAVGAVIWWRRR